MFVLDDVLTTRLNNTCVKHVQQQKLQMKFSQHDSECF